MRRCAQRFLAESPGGHETHSKRPAPHPVVRLDRAAPAAWCGAPAQTTALVAQERTRSAQPRRQK